MPIADDKRWSVAFVVKEEMTAAGTVRNAPIGTGFFVQFAERIPGTDRPDPRHSNVTHFESIRYTYFVTCAHVAKHAHPAVIRVHKKEWDRGWRGGDVVDLSLGDGSGWVFNPDPGKDVAVMPVNISQDDYYFVPVGGQTHHREDDSRIWVGSRRYAALGERVFFVGLLGNVPAMGDANIPMVRTGTLGAIWQDGIPVDLGGNRLKVKGHLIDCHAYAGFSGSPVFLHRETVVLTKKKKRLRPHVIGGPTKDEYEQEEAEFTPFLGMLAGHFPYKEKVRPKTPDNYEVDVNAGVAVVVPKDYIWETLAQEDLVKDRAERMRKAEEEVAARDDHEEHGAAVPDVIKPGPEPERLHIDESFEEAVEKAMKKEKPEEGWPD